MRFFLLREEGFRHGDRLWPEVYISQRSLQALLIWPDHSMLYLDILEEAFIVLRLDQAHESDRNIRFSVALGLNARADSCRIFDQHHHLGGRGGQV